MYNVMQFHARIHTHPYIHTITSREQKEFFFLILIPLSVYVPSIIYFFQSIYRFFCFVFYYYDYFCCEIIASESRTVSYDLIESRFAITLGMPSRLLVTVAWKPVSQSA